MSSKQLSNPERLLPFEFWQDLETCGTIGSASDLPFIHVVNGTELTIPVYGSPETNLVSLFGDDVPTVGTEERPEDWTERPALLLRSIFLPESLQRQGLGTEIIRRLRERAVREKRVFGVHPVMEEPMHNLCCKLKLSPCLPFSYYAK